MNINCKSIFMLAAVDADFGCTNFMIIRMEMIRFFSVYFIKQHDYKSFEIKISSIWKKLSEKQEGI